MDREVEKNKNLMQIEMHIASISKNTVRDDVINWFQQSPLHWLFILFLMKFYYLNKELSKQMLIESINEHLPTDGKKTVTTEFKYIEDAISKGYVYSEKSQKDSRKRILFPTEKTIKSVNEWFEKFSSNFNEL
tara:strand:+ start:1071 stop:1469 length:399 start_codon:yes stop_codon:yes gene_type:complete